MSVCPVSDPWWWSTTWRTSSTVSRRLSKPCPPQINWIIFFTSDHGFHLGQFGLLSSMREVKWPSNKLSQKFFWSIFQTFPDRLNAFIEILFCNFSYTPCPQKKLPVCFLAISQLLLGQIPKVRSVLKSARSEEFKTVLTFDIWPSRSWDNWG